MRISTLFAALALPLAAFAAGDGDYPVVVDKNQNYTRTDRHLDGVYLNGSADGNQSLAINAPRKVYTIIDEPALSARAGETVTPGFNYTGTWMNGFVYIDRGMDGAFEATLNSNGTIPAGSDIMAFSYAIPESGNTGYNSTGAVVNGGNVLNPPAFTVPADLAPGFYRMRYKVDWASIDPAGRPEDGNGILKNGGAICDVRLNVHAAEGAFSVKAENGTLLAADGSALPATVAFGEPLAIKLEPAEGYVLDFVKVKHGHGLNGEQFIHGVQQYSEVSYPGYLVKGNLLEIAGEHIDGDVVVEAVFIKAGDGAGGEGYALSFDKNAAASNAANTITVNGKSFEIDGTKGYYDFTDAPVAMYNTRDVNVAFANATGKNCYLYIDLNNDGRFVAVVDGEGNPVLSSELVAAGTLQCAMPEVVADGVYRARVKVDADNINPDGSEGIIANGGYVADFLLNVVSGSRSLVQHTAGGSIDGTGYTALPMTVTPGQGFEVVLRGGAPGFEAKELVVRHGCNINGEEFINGNRQWSEDVVEAVNGKATVAASLVDGEVALYAVFEAEEGNEWRLVFSDEFNDEDYARPSGNKWVNCPRYAATWNRWISNSDEVIYQQGGDLVARAIPNPDQESDPVPMITGAVRSHGKFGFTYGYVEARILSNPWVGHFPAFWLMPEDQSAGWPDCGEIDIWEAIDTDGKSYHTIHSNWTYDLGNKNNPKSSYNTGVNYDRYHTYGLKWDENTLIWYVDGKEVGRYAKSTVASQLSQGQWPFDKHFHIILNQSVGNGSWAKNADVNHTYETRFDWVRVYQMDGMENTSGTVGIVTVNGDERTEVSAAEGGIAVSVSSPREVSVYDIAGRKVAQMYVADSSFIPVAAGVYVVEGCKLMVK